MGIKLTALQYGKTKITQRMAFFNGDKDIELPISLMFFLIEEGERKILVDTGCETMPGFTLYDFESPVKILKKHGVLPEEITDVLITHAHHDHIDCVRYYKSADIYIHEEEAKDGKEYLADCKKINTFKNEINISKSVNMKCIGGHTTGSSIVLINTKMTTYVLCGDECYTMENLYSLTPTGSSCCREKSIFFVNEYSQSCYTPIVFHDEVLVGENGAKEIANNELDLKVFNNEC